METGEKRLRIKKGEPWGLDVLGIGFRILAAGFLRQEKEKEKERSSMGHEC